jgi:hypothetical protein
MLLIFAAILALTTPAFAQTTSPDTGVSSTLSTEQPAMPLVRSTMPANELLTTPRAIAPRKELSVPEKVAAKAINGHFGPIAEWQRVGYTRIIERGTVKKTAWITSYWSGEPGVGTICASGRKVEENRTAAMLRPDGNRLRGRSDFGYFVLIELPQGHELRQVWDTGSPSNQGRAQRLGAETWIDRYVTKPTGKTWVRPIYILNGYRY